MKIVYLFFIFLLFGVTSISALTGINNPTIPKIGLASDYALLDGNNIFTGQNLFNGVAPQSFQNKDICSNSFEVYKWGSDDGSCMGGRSLMMYWNNESRHLQFLDGNEDPITLDANINGTIGGGSFVKKAGDQMSGDLNFSSEFVGIGYRSFSGIDTTYLHADGGNIRLQADAVEIPNSVLTLGDQSADSASIGNANAILQFQGTLGGSGAESLNIDLGDSNNINVSSFSGVTSFNVQGLDLKQNGVKVCLANGTNCGAAGNATFNQSLTDRLYNTTNMVTNGSRGFCVGDNCTTADMNRRGLVVNDSAGAGIIIANRQAGTTYPFQVYNQNISVTTANAPMGFYIELNDVARPVIGSISKNGNKRQIWEFRDDGGTSVNIFQVASKYTLTNNVFFGGQLTSTSNANILGVSNKDEVQVGTTSNFANLYGTSFTSGFSNTSYNAGALTLGEWTVKEGFSGGSVATRWVINCTGNNDNCQFRNITSVGKLYSPTVNASNYVGNGENLSNVAKLNQQNRFRSENQFNQIVMNETTGANGTGIVNGSGYITWNSDIQFDGVGTQFTKQLTAGSIVYVNGNNYTVANIIDDTSFQFDDTVPYATPPVTAVNYSYVPLALRIENADGTFAYYNRDNGKMYIKDLYAGTFLADSFSTSSLQVGYLSSLSGAILFTDTFDFDSSGQITGASLVQTDTLTSTTTYASLISMTSSSITGTGNMGEVRRNASGLYMSNGTRWNCVASVKGFGIAC